MRGGQGRQPLDVPLDGRVSNTAFARMPGVLNHVHGWDHLGWLRYLASQTPLVASDRRKLLGDGSVWILVTSGSLNSNSTRARTSLVPKPLPSCEYPPVTGLFRNPRSVSSSHIRPRFQRATYDWAYPIGSPFSIAYGDGPCAKTLGKYCSCTSASVGRASSPPHHSTI